LNKDVGICFLAMSKSPSEKPVPNVETMVCADRSQSLSPGKEIRDSNYLNRWQSLLRKGISLDWGLIDQMFAEYRKLFEEK